MGKTMSARDRILTRIQRASAPNADAPAPLKPAMAEATGDIAIAQFTAKAEAVNSTVSRIASMDDLPMAVAEELRNRNLPATIRTGEDPVFDRDWGTVERSTGPGRETEPATMTMAKFGLAETGSVVMTSGPDNPATLNFLGETHFAVIKAKDIQSGFEDLWAGYREQNINPRTVNLITGPSRSGDIGQTLQLGAHGPVALHIFVVDD